MGGRAGIGSRGGWSVSELPPDLAAAARLGGEAGRCFAAFDWDGHLLGPPSEWPAAFRSTVAVALASRFPVVLWLGDGLTTVYNDGYIAMLADKHPWAMGMPALEVWWEIREIIEPMLAGVVRSGVATWSDDLLLMLVDKGRPWEKYFTFTYSPIFLEDGGVGGVFCAVAETTERVLGERRLRVLSSLGAVLVDVLSVEETVAASIAVCEEQPADLPFVAVYLVEPTSGSTTLRGATSAVADQLGELAPTAGFWCVPEAVETSGLLVADLAARLGDLGARFAGGAPEAALVLPLADPASVATMGVIVVGLNRHRPLDEQYRGFCRLFADQVASGIASAGAYEAERGRAQSLAELDRAKTVFLTNVSHELRTPLTLMLGPLEDALALAGSDPELQGQLEVVERSARRLLRLVNSLLDFARIEAGRATARLVEADLGTLTADIASSFSDLCRRAGIDLVLDCRPAVGQVDPEMWETIVLNLLSNAFKFTFAGSITVRVTPAVEGTVELSVADTGVGIAQAEQDRIFERFYRPSSNKGRSVEGSGIGLALVQNLVELHGGKVSVQSAEGAGTTFSVTLPALASAPAAAVAAAAAVAPAPATTPAARSGAERVYVTEAAQWLERAAGEVSSAAEDGPAPPELPRPIVVVADDNADLRGHLERVIGSRWSVVSAGDGVRALELVRRLEPDLVVADVMMPSLDGFELIHHLRADPRLEAIPVVLLSARAGTEAVGEGFAAGADDYLIKPFRSTDLLNRVAARLKLAARDRDRRERERFELERASGLAELGASLSAAGGETDIAAGVLESPLRAHGLHTVGLGVCEETTGLVRMTYAGPFDPELADRYHAIAADAPVPLAQVASSGQAMVITDTGELDDAFEPAVSDLAGQVRAAIVEPLRTADGACLGVLALHWCEPRRFSELELDLAHEVARLAARAVERVRRAERERRVAVALQERLLEWGASSVPAAIWTTYEPATDTMRVGGDWYTITALDERGRIGVSAGDVVGHGLPAATVMSELRSALAAASLALKEPDEVLALLERYARQVPGAECTTVAYVLVDPGSGRLSYACAGHPCPVLVGPDGDAVLLDGGRRPALAASSGVGAAAQGSAELPPGALLLLYTDGLVERRGESLEVGLGRLLEAARAAAGKPVGEVCAEVLTALRGPAGYEDDVVLVALRPCGATDDSYVDAFPATVGQMPGARARLRHWLSSRVDDDTVLEVLITVGEAIANAIEHGSRSERSMVTLEAFLFDGELTTTVTDSGRWDSDSAGSRRVATRGRGLTLIHGMSTAVAIERHERGTRVTMGHRARPRGADLVEEGR